MNNRNIALKYLEYLEQGQIGKVIDLFHEDGMVHSPIYGVKPASEFYLELSNDTSNSKLILKDIFENTSNTLALYFTYEWTLKNNKVVKFDVIDIIELTTDLKIKTLKIIYDTVVARALIKELN